MHKNKYEGRHLNAGEKTLRRGKLTSTVVAIALLLTLTVGGTVAWLFTKTDPVTNTFTPSSVTCEVTEDFNKETGVKENVNVKNTGNIAAYIRVKLVTYRTNDNGQHIGGTASLPEFTLGTGWVKYGNYYYYTLPVAPNQMPATNLANSMTLAVSYDDADGGKQAIDVMAEAIQSVPQAAVQAAWGSEFSINADGTLSVSAALTGEEEQG